MAQHPVPRRVSRVPKLPQKGQFLLAAVRTLPRQVRRVLFLELAADLALRPELESALSLTLPPRPPKEPRKRLIPSPVEIAKGVANKTAERLAAASYPYVVSASARLVAISGWMANNYVRHAHNGQAAAAAAREARMLNPVD